MPEYNHPTREDLVAGRAFRVVANTNSHNYPIGSVATVPEDIQFGNGGGFRLLRDDGSLGTWIRYDCLEIIDNTPVIKPHKVVFNRIYPVEDSSCGVYFVCSPDEFGQNWQTTALQKFARQYRMNVYIFDRIFDLDKYNAILNNGQEKIILSSFIKEDYSQVFGATPKRNMNGNELIRYYINSSYPDLLAYRNDCWYSSWKLFASYKKVENEKCRKEQFNILLDRLRAKFVSRLVISVKESSLDELNLSMFKNISSDITRQINACKEVIAQRQADIASQTSRLVSYEKLLNNSKTILSSVEISRQISEISSLSEIKTVTVESNNEEFKVVVLTNPLVLNLPSGVLPMGSLTIIVSIAVNGVMKMLAKSNTFQFPHSHSNGDICWGGFQDIITKQFAIYNIKGAIETILLWSSTYNPGSAYNNINYIFQNKVIIDEVEFMSKPQVEAEELDFS